MKNKEMRLSLLIVALALTAQLSFVSPSIQAQNANSSTTNESMMQNNNNNGPGIPGSPCRRRCTMTYRKCLRAADGNPGRRRACAVRFRNCTRHCPQ
jgi:hypothetical protein